MRRQADEEVAAAARRRLEMLRVQLGLEGQAGTQAGTQAATGSGLDGRPGVAPAVPPAQTEPVLPTGRHLRRTVRGRDRWAAWLGDRLPEGLRGRIALGPREAMVVAILAAAGVVVTAVVVLRASGGETQAPATTGPGAVLLTPAAGPGGATGLSSPPAARSSPATSATAGEVVVDVSGRVRRPGVLRLPVGSRIIDAVHRAGGASRRRDLDGLNLAQVLVDGEQVVVGPGGAAPVGGAGAGAAANASTAGPLVDLNSATEEQLESLPGVGPVTAAKILAFRSAHGSFTSVDELTEVDGIGDKTLADLAPYVTL